MPKFSISGKITITVYTVVEAETIEAAIEEAKHRTPMAIIPNGGDNELENWMADEMDGEPFDLRED